MADDGYSSGIDPIDLSQQHFDVMPSSSMDRMANNRIQILEKYIEPENNIHGKQFNRNLQMGNIKPEDLPILEQFWINANLLEFVPPNQGAFIFTEIGQLFRNSVNFRLTSSNSVNGTGRASGLTITKREEFKDATPRGFADSWFGKNKNNQGVS